MGAPSAKVSIPHWSWFIQLLPQVVFICPNVFLQAWMCLRAKRAQHGGVAVFFAKWSPPSPAPHAWWPSALQQKETAMAPGISSTILCRGLRVFQILKVLFCKCIYIFSCFFSIFWGGVLEYHFGILYIVIPFKMYNFTNLATWVHLGYLCGTPGWLHDKCHVAHSFWKLSFWNFAQVLLPSYIFHWNCPHHPIWMFVLSCSF